MTESELRELIEEVLDDEYVDVDTEELSELLAKKIMHTFFSKPNPNQEKWIKESREHKRMIRIE